MGVFFEVLAGCALHFMRDQPIMLNIEVTKACNARCKFCTYWKEGGHMSAETLSDIRRVSLQKHIPFISLTGGEPLLRKDLPGLVASFRGKYVSIVTNGSLLDYGLAKELKECGLSQLLVSLDFLGEEHDRQRGIRGLFGHITEIMPQLAELNLLNLSFNTAILSTNLREIPRIVEYAHKIGVNNQFNPYQQLKTNDPSLMPSKEDMAAISQYLINRKRAGHGIMNSERFIENLPTYAGAGAVGDHCNAWNLFFHITPSGTIKPCPDLVETPHRITDDFKDIQSTVRKRIGRCTSCWNQCRGENECAFSPSSVADKILYALKAHGSG